MAIWQFNIEFIPKQSLINKYGHIPAELYVDREAWQNHFKNSDFEGDYDFEDALSIYWWLDFPAVVGVVTNNRMMSLVCIRPRSAFSSLLVLLSPTTE